MELEQGTEASDEVGKKVGIALKGGQQKEYLGLSNIV